ncbi:M15 family metallopeptidase domain-containing protein [Pedobacter sp.]
MNSYPTLQLSDTASDLNADMMLYSISDVNNICEELLPLVKRLISLCAANGFYVKIINRNTIIRNYLMDQLSFDFVAIQEATDQIKLSYHNHGLAFGIGIYESSASGKLKYVDHDVLYDKVAKLGESIGLVWAGRQTAMPNLRYFEFRPEWARNISDNEMMNELYRRKQTNTSLLATNINN